MKIFSTLAAFILLSTTLSASETYHIKPQFKESSQYDISGRTSMNLKFSSNGMQLPQGPDGSSVNMNAQMKASFATHNQVPEKGLAFTYSYDQVDYDIQMPGMEHLTTPQPLDSLLLKASPITGFISENQTSFSSGDQAFDMKINQNDMINQWIFPNISSITYTIDSQVAIGDSIILNSNLDLPDNPFGAPILYKAIYKLTTVREGKAYFDVSYSMLSETAIDSPTDMSFNVNGLGNAVYHLEDQYFTIDASTVKAQIHMSFSEDMKMDMNMSLDQYTESKLKE